MKRGKKQIQDVDALTRLNTTKVQNKFLLLYSIIFEAQCRRVEMLKVGKDRELVDKEYSSLSLVLNTYKLELYRALGFDNGETCMEALTESGRFTIDECGNINIK